MLSKRLKQIRKLKNLTQAEVANAIGIGARNYQSFEYGEIKPSFETLISLADYFQVSLDYLVGRSDVNYYSENETKISIQESFTGMLISEFICKHYSELETIICSEEFRELLNRAKQGSEKYVKIGGSGSGMFHSPMKREFIKEMQKQHKESD